MIRSDALARYEALPLPDTTDEPWRFTDLKGFDPEQFSAAPNGAGVHEHKRTGSELLDIAVAGGYRWIDNQGHAQGVDDGTPFGTLALRPTR